MESFLGILVIYYMFVFILVGIVGSIVISLPGDVYDLDNCLKNKQDFIRCIFMYQYVAYLFLDLYGINKIGITLVEILLTISVWFLNMIIFIWLCFELFLKGICYLFWIVFRKRDVK